MADLLCTVTPGDPAPHGGRACCTRLVDLGVRLGSFRALEGVNLHVHCGEVTAIVGPNGAGKTTLLRALLGEVPHTGELVFLPSARPASSLRPRVGYVPQRMEIDKTSPLTVLDLFAAARSRRPLWLGASLRIKEEASHALRTVSAEDLQHKKLGHLSCGQLQRVLLALALTPVPELLLLDEPLAGLDHGGTAQFYEVVSGLRRVMDLSVLLVSHDLKAAAAVADRMIFLKQGALLFEGPPAQVLAQRLVREAFGFDGPPGFPRVGEPERPNP